MVTKEKLNEKDYYSAFSQEVRKEGDKLIKIEGGIPKIDWAELENFEEKSRMIPNFVDMVKRYCILHEYRAGVLSIYREKGNCFLEIGRNPSMDRSRLYHTSIERIIEYRNQTNQKRSGINMVID